MSELSPEGGSEGYGGCDDDVKSLDESVDGMMSVMAGLGSKAQRPAQFFLGTVLAGSQEGKKGDIVVMLTEDLQTYYLICKVVAL